jgi:hypothetical protein
MNQRGVSLALEKLIIFILIIIVVLLVLWAIFRFGALDYLRDLFPDFSSGNIGYGDFILGLIK